MALGLDEISKTSGLAIALNRRALGAPPDVTVVASSLKRSPPDPHLTTLPARHPRASSLRPPPPLPCHQDIWTGYCGCWLQPLGKQVGEARLSTAVVVCAAQGGGSTTGCKGDRRDPALRRRCARDRPRSEARCGPPGCLAPPEGRPRSDGRRTCSRRRAPAAAPRPVFGGAGKHAVVRQQSITALALLPPTLSRPREAAPSPSPPSTAGLGGVSPHTSCLSVADIPQASPSRPFGISADGWPGEFFTAYAATTARLSFCHLGGTRTGGCGRRRGPGRPCVA